MCYLYDLPQVQVGDKLTILNEEDLRQLTPKDCKLSIVFYTQHEPYL